MSITKGPFSVYSLIHNCIFNIISQISIKQIHKPSVSRAVSVSELQPESDARLNITCLRRIFRRC